MPKRSDEDYDRIIKDRKKRAHDADIFKSLQTIKCRESTLLAALLLWPIMSIHGRNKHSIKEDIIGALYLAAEAPIKKFDEFTKLKLKEVATKDAKAILDSMEPADEYQALIGACMMIAKLQDEGRIVDSMGQPVLVSVALLEEASDGEEGAWRYSSELAAIMSGKAIKTAERLGYFL